LLIRFLTDGKPAHFELKWRGLFWFGAMVIAIALAVAVIALQHKIRHLETDYYNALKARQALYSEWGKLQLEQSHLTARARVQQIAEQKLNLRLEKGGRLHNQQIIVLAPQPQSGRNAKVQAQPNSEQGAIE
jgi:cell division protein FtsL